MKTQPILFATGILRKKEMIIQLDTLKLCEKIDSYYFVRSNLLSYTFSIITSMELYELRRLLNIV